MSAGTRDQRLRVYTRVDSTNSGVPVRSYLYADTWWGRIVEPTSSEVTVGLAAGQRIDGIAHFADEAVLTDTGLVLDEDGHRWEIRGIVTNRTTRSLKVRLERANEAQSADTVRES